MFALLLSARHSIIRAGENAWTIICICLHISLSSIIFQSFCPSYEIWSMMADCMRLQTWKGTNCNWQCTFNRTNIINNTVLCKAFLSQSMRNKEITCPAIHVSAAQVRPIQTLLLCSWNVVYGLCMIPLPKNFYAKWLIMIKQRNNCTRDTSIACWIYLHEPCHPPRCSWFVSKEL